MPTSVTHLLIHTVSTYRNAQHEVSAGRWEKEPTLHLSNIAFRVAGASGAERQTAQQLKTYATHAGYGEPDIDIKRDDIVVKDGVSYRVVALVLPSIAHHTKVLLEEIQRG